MPLDPDDLDARRALVESESVRIVRRRGDLIISETAHGFVCANAGIDLSNVEAGLGRAAARRRRPLGEARPRRVARAGRRRGRGDRLRHVRTAVAPGAHRRRDRRERDRRGRSTCATRPTRPGASLQVTEVAIADEIASAAELVMGKASGVPVAIVRGLDPSWFGEGSVRELIRPPQEDLFR